MFLSNKLLNYTSLIFHQKFTRMKKFILLAFFTLLLVGFKQAPPGKTEVLNPVELNTTQPAEAVEVFALRTSELFALATLERRGDAAEFANVRTGTEGPARLRIFYTFKNFSTNDGKFSKTSKYGRAEKDAGNRKA